MGPNPRLVGYVVAAAGAEVDAAGLRHALSESSGLHGSIGDCCAGSVAADAQRQARPSYGRCLNSIQQPTLEAALSRLPREPRESMQDRLANIWKSLLGVQFVGIHDDFFELGGHSLLVMRLLAQIEKEFGVRIPLTAIFQAPAIATVGPPNP